jgi:hypothetical protein
MVDSIEELTEGDLKKFIELSQMHGMGIDFCIEKGGEQTHLVLEPWPETTGPLRNALYPDVVGASDKVFKELEHDFLGHANVHADVEDIIDNLLGIKKKGYKFYRSCRLRD